MSGDGKGIAADLRHVDRDFAGGLHRVSVKTNARLRLRFSDLLDRLQDSGLIVRHHDRDQLGVRPQSAAHIGGIDQAAAIHRQNCYLRTHVFQMLAGMQHRMMLNARGDDVVAGT